MFWSKYLSGGWNPLSTDPLVSNSLEYKVYIKDQIENNNAQLDKKDDYVNAGELYMNSARWINTNNMLGDWLRPFHDWVFINEQFQIDLLKNVSPIATNDYGAYTYVGQGKWAAPFYVRNVFGSAWILSTQDSLVIWDTWRVRSSDQDTLFNVANLSSGCDCWLDQLNSYWYHEGQFLGVYRDYQEWMEIPYSIVEKSQNQGLLDYLNCLKDPLTKDGVTHDPFIQWKLNNDPNDNFNLRNLLFWDQATREGHFKDVRDAIQARIDLCYQ